MTTLLLHSATFFVVFLLLVLLARVVYVRRVLKPHRQEIAALKTALYKLGLHWLDATREKVRLEHNIRAMAIANNDLCDRHRWANARVCKLQGDVQARIIVIQHLRRANEELTHRANVQAELLTKGKRKGERRTATECLTH